MANTNNAAAQAATTETVNVQPQAAAPTFTQEQLDAIVAGAVAAALKQAAAQAEADKAAADKAAAEKAAFDKAVQEKVAAEKAAAEKAAAPTASTKVASKTGPKEGEVTISEKEFKALQERQTINNYFGGCDNNTSKSDSDELDPWIVGGIAIGFVAVVAGVYYWVLKD